jgi:hypothetical protein
VIRIHLAAVFTQKKDQGGQARPGGVSGVREVMVTSEPRGGSRLPTTKPVIVARVS